MQVIGFIHGLVGPGPAAGARRLALCVLAPLILSIGVASCSNQAPEPPRVDPELVEIQGVLEELDRGPSLENALALSTPVDIERLPDRPIVPPEVLVTEREYVPVAAPLEPQPTPVVLEPAPTEVAAAPAAPKQAPAPRQPASLAARCAALYGERCEGKGYATDVCVRDLVRCELTSPTVDGPPPCCPERCIEEYARYRRGGASVAAAGAAVFDQGGCLAPLVGEVGEDTPAKEEAPLVPQPPPAPPNVGAQVGASLRKVLAAPAPRPLREAQGLPSVEAVAPPDMQAQPVE